jgi:4-nitrophenyl phosphatase
MALADAYDAPCSISTESCTGATRPWREPETLRALRTRGHRLVFVTNNSARTPEQVVAKLVAHGFEASPGEVVSSALATADLLASRGGGTAYVVGEEGIRSALAAAGVEVLGGEPAEVAYVVVGWDRRVTTTNSVASLLVQRGARLVATNADRSFPRLWPGAGALLAVIARPRAPAEIVGNTAPVPGRPARGGERPLVVGDRLETDIAGAVALGWDSLLVLSGVTDRAALERSGDRPYVAEIVGAAGRAVPLGQIGARWRREDRSRFAPVAEQQPRRRDAEGEAPDVRPVGDPAVHLGSESSCAAEQLQEEPPAERHPRREPHRRDDEEEDERRDARPRDQDEIGAEHGGRARGADGRRRVRSERQLQQHGRDPTAGVEEHEPRSAGRSSTLLPNTHRNNMFTAMWSHTSWRNIETTTAALQLLLAHRRSK